MHPIISRREILASPLALYPVGAMAANPKRIPTGTLTDVAGLKVGHFSSEKRPTGCTVVLAESGAVAGVDVRGGAPGSRETDLLRPEMSVQQVNAIVLSGGSAYGLAAADGVMRYLEERGIGFATSAGVVPIVPAAILYDLGLGEATIRPDAQAGYEAAKQASSDPVPQGNAGAGAGAGRFEAEAASGVSPRRGLLTPYTGVAVSESGETWRAGARWKPGPAYEVSLEASLTDPAGVKKPGGGVLLRGAKRW